ncbi:LAMI_0G06084g1_1 [Lachancea mirantina]|uniref:LAMI_0G06084g1_1 n=1 Tax=Lachancea mirantina TaxID=1230905 RepID=A0A1G4K925_9SACH|nr:LAMI_0G06084g1_1 [Lachancea mirantina]
MADIAICKNGFSPYIDSTTNALNPCFVSLVSIGHAGFFSIVGVIQLWNLYREERIPPNFKYASLWKATSTKQFLHLTSVFLQSALLLGSLAVTPTQSPQILKWSWLSQLLHVTLISLPVQYLQYFRSTVAVGGQLFYYVTQGLLYFYLIGQRIGHHPDEAFNFVPRIQGAFLEVALLLNSMTIFLYDLISYEPSRELTAYYEEHDLIPDCNIISNLTFTWMNPLIRQVHRDGKIKDPHKMPLPPTNIDVRQKAALLESKWEQEKWRGRNSLFWAIFASFGKTIMLGLSLEILKDFAVILQPQLLRIFIEQFSEDYRSKYPALNGVFVAVSLFLVKIFSTCLSNQFFIMIFQAGMGIRGSLMAMVYRKSLTLSVDARNNKASGDILNLMAVDVLRIQRFFETSQDLIGAPIALVTTLISLYTFLGFATIGGLLTMAVMIPVNTYLSKKIRNLIKTQMEYKDARIKTVTEILNSVKSIKLYAWEKPMLERLNHVRNDLELSSMRKIGIVDNLITFAWNLVPVMVACSTFAIFSVTMDVPLSPQIVFPSLTLFNILNECVYSIPTTITNFIETSVSVGRLKDLLLATDTDQSFIEYRESSKDSKEPALEISNATFLWRTQETEKESSQHDEEAEVETPRIALKDIDHFEARKGDITCIVGRVGSGKSSFLSALLGHLPCVSGARKQLPPKFIMRASSIAYCPQQPWVMNATVKENVLFGHRFDETYYRATLDACQLGQDLKILPDGDETVVGEKGISLSGGQKARLSLARAVYSRSDVYLLDDILSAVDAQVSKSIIDNVLDRTNGLLKNKTIILSTNSITVLKHCQSIYALQHGEIVETGSFEDVMKRGKESVLKVLIEEFDSDTSSPALNTEEASKEQEVISLVNEETLIDEDIAESVNSLEVVNRQLGVIVSRRASLATLRPHPITDMNKDTRKTAQEAEKTQEGRVKTAVYISYIKACGPIGVALFFAFLGLERFFEVSESFWLKHWSEKNEKTGYNKDVVFYVGIYALIAIASALFNVLRYIILLLYCSLRASRKLHDNMAQSVLRSPMSFFETTPVGRIINRFSSDVNSVDDGLHFIFSFFFYSLLDYVVVIVLIGYNMPWFLVINAGLLLLYLYYQTYYITLSRELKRLMSTTFSPIMSTLSETLAGHTVINAYDHFRRFEYLNFENVQFNINCVYNFRSTNRWLSVRLESIGAFIILSTALLSLATITTSRPMTAGLVGLLMSYAIEVTTDLMWIVRMSVQIETNIVSVERIIEYCDLPSEAPAVIESCRPPKNWPSSGLIEFKGYSTTYRPNLPPVLKKINLTVKPQEKIGIVGRTGAGKSTLSLALFRLLEPSEGTIVIDGIDIAKLGLSDLRSHLAIIPQDAQAFEGTIRSNLDPFEQFSDEEIWKVLELSHLKPHIAKMAADSESVEGGDMLKIKITENGGNLSVGQRQLLCLSRALLNQSKILVLDEATAAVDLETDKLIQETIRSAFQERTILTIAHRIDSVMDSDRIMVLDQGEVKEFDAPAVLLKDRNTIFYNLCEKGGYLK